jgi:hypothetical protein
MPYSLRYDFFTKIFSLFVEDDVNQQFFVEDVYSQKLNNFLPSLFIWSLTFDSQPKQFLGWFSIKTQYNFEHLF